MAICLWVSILSEVCLCFSIPSSRACARSSIPGRNVRERARALVYLVREHARAVYAFVSLVRECARPPSFYF